jgi:hypothetical protein
VAGYLNQAQVSRLLLRERAKSIRVRVRCTKDVPAFCDEEVMATS